MGDQARVIMEDYMRDRYMRDRMAQEGLGDQVREEDLYEPGPPSPRGGFSLNPANITSSPALTINYLRAANISGRNLIYRPKEISLVSRN